MPRPNPPRVNWVGSGRETKVRKSHGWLAGHKTRFASSDKLQVADGCHMFSVILFFGGS